MRNVSDKVVEKIKTHVLYSTVSRQSCSLWDIVGKCGRVGQTTDENTAHFALHTG